MQPEYKNKHYKVFKSFDEDSYYVQYINPLYPNHSNIVSPSTPDYYMAVGWAEAAETQRMIEELEMDGSELDYGDNER